MSATTGIVFDLQRGSMHDGPGIRTTVFLKGCPLHCVWCHNPESQRRTPELGFDSARCVGCRACEAACREHVHTFTAQGQHLVRFDACTAHGACVEACPAEALRLYGTEQSVGEIMTEVEKDRAYYDASGGGLTLSGGEPTAQFEFCRALLEAACKSGIHTCVETCGLSAPETLLSLTPVTDLFLFDWKVTDPGKHAVLTGVSNELIHRNLCMLHEAGAAIILRCPLVPEVNDDRDHLQGIARLTQTLPNLRGVEVLPFHDSGTGKYQRIGRIASGSRFRVPDRPQIDAWHGTLRAAQCRSLMPV